MRQVSEAIESKEKARNLNKKIPRKVAKKSASFIRRRPFLSAILGIGAGAIVTIILRSLKVQEPRTPLETFCRAWASR